MNALRVTLPVQDTDEPDVADLLSALVAAHVSPSDYLGQVHLGRDGVTLSIPEAAADVLRALPSDHDGHLDEDGLLWIGGTEYQTWGAASTG